MPETGTMRKGSATTVGPFRAWTPLKPGITLVCVLLQVACATGGGSADPFYPPIDAGPDSPTAPGDMAEARSAIGDSALALVNDGRWARAGELTDSILPGSGAEFRMGAGDALALSALLRHLGEEDRAARLLMDHPTALESGAGIDELRASASGLSVVELDALHRGLATVRIPAYAVGVVEAEYARALALAGDAGNAERVAGTVSQDDVAMEDRQTVRDILAGRIRPSPRPVVIGAILSLTGRFARVGESLRDGIELAVDDWNSTASPGERVELAVRDDGSERAESAGLLAELEALGVTAIIGPIRSDDLLEVAASRSTAALTLVSPTAARDSGAGHHAFSLWERSRRERAIGEALGQWFPETMGLFRLAALYPDSDGGRAGFLAFESAAVASGALITAAATYQPDSTTFQLPIESVAESDPEAVLVLSDDAATVLQIAPQLSYFGLRSRVIAGGESWSEPAVLRRLDSSFSDYRVVATFIDRSDPESAWTRYVDAYEREFRQPVPENLLPALGYDATRVVLKGVSREALGRPGAVSRGILDAGYLDGATGTIRWSWSGRPAREVEVKMVLDRQLVEPDPAAISAWAEEARAQEELMKQLEEEEEKRKAAREGGGT